MTSHQVLAVISACILGLLCCASVVGILISHRSVGGAAQATLINYNDRVRAWWLMCLLVMGSLWAGAIPVIVLFSLISFQALREFITLTPTRRSDHHTLFWCFFVIIPFQYWFIAVPWYGMMSIFIPVWAFLFISVRGTLSGNSRNYLERTAKIQWGMMLCVYCISHIPALLMLDIPRYHGHDAQLLLFLLVVVQLSDVFQYVWGKLLGRHAIAPHLSPHKTWEGFLGGIATATGIGSALWWMTPFSPWAAAGMAVVVAVMGFAGGIVMSAIKRDAGIKDFGSIIAGHGGILDRVDSLCFSAPVFFHLVRFYYSQ